MNRALLLSAMLPVALGFVGCGGGDDGGPQPTTVQIVKAFPQITFDRPLYVTVPPGDHNHLFVVTQRGVIFVLETDLENPPMKIYLDISGRVATAPEMGLLGLAFDPDYASNGFLYVDYTPRFDTSPANPRRTNVSRFTVRSDNPDRADPMSETVLLTFAQPTASRKGGWVGFGPDGKLYIASGDGDQRGDPRMTAQNPGLLLGKILRINPDGTFPPDNPFFSTEGTLAHIWALGLRNPRPSFDRATGELWAADPGQDRFSEVDKIVSGGNYGWRKFEGSHVVRPNDPEITDALPPVFEYQHADNRCGIVGGYVYRGGALGGNFAGSYFFADSCTSELFHLPNADTAAEGATATLLGTIPGKPASFGEDADGELYVTSSDGHLYKLERGEDPEPGAN